MRKSLITLLSALMAVSLAGCSSSSAAASASASASALYTAGTYTASASGHSSDVTVTAEFSSDAIKSVTIDASGETESIGGAAVEDLQNEIMSAQSADIDAVSGATETSNAVKTAMADVIAQAKGEDTSTAAKTSLKDGTYTETVASFGVTGMMTGDVTIQDQKITDIKITKETDSATGQWFSVAENLLIPRIIDAQSLDVDSITGATTSSGAIKNIVAAAINDAGGNDTEWRTSVEKKTDTVVKDGYDAIVVGLGGSGLMAYAAAAKAGASVFGIEAAGEIGGNSASVYGPMALNSKNLAEKYNNGEDYIDEDDVYKTWLEYVGTDEKADVIKEAVYQSGSALDYYMDNFDYSFDGLNGLLGSFVRTDWDKEWTVYTADENNTKWYAFGPDHTYQFRNALEKAKAMNEKNDYMTELTAEELITDDNGNVTGVRAQYYDGTTYEIYGRTVILATGGFLGNDDMMKEVYGSTVHTIGNTVNKGTGIQMGQSVGGATYALGTLPMIHVSQVPNIIRDDTLTADQKAILSAIATTSDAKEIDETGAILGTTDESGTTNSELTVGIAYAPGFHYYNAYTEEDLEKMKTEGLSETTAAVSIFGLNQGGTVPAAGTPIEDLDTIVDAAIATNNAWSGTPAELAEKLGMDADKLTASLGDADQTYYLFECAGYSYGTVGGLDVDVNMNVLKEDGTPITNLFAVGQDSEGVCNKEGEAYSPWGGQAQSWTFVSGKIAGEAAASLAAGSAN
ncbi:MAG: FAD-binding protein [Stecheria intestinalis]|nr:FAD-binding protein [Stecheria intestinalis]